MVWAKSVMVANWLVVVRQGWPFCRWALRARPNVFGVDESLEDVAARADGGLIAVAGRLQFLGTGVWRRQAQPSSDAWSCPREAADLPGAR